MPECDILIVGQGLAGTVLCEAFLQSGSSVHVVDQGFDSASSVVAAGMYNPVVFKRLNKGWMADELLPAAVSLYTEMERKLDLSLVRSYSILKFFPNDDYRKLWEEAILKGNQYICTPGDEYNNPLIRNDFGFGRVTQCGRVVLKDMLSSYRTYLNSIGAITEEPFDFDALDIEAGTYKGLKFGKVIFCQGHAGVNNPYFADLPLQKTKGELLKIRAKEINSEDLLNKGFFLVPLGNDEYLVGSTYDWQDKTTEPTVEGKRKILEKLERLYTGPYEVIDHTAGLRPTVKDRRPLIGLRGKNRQFGIFNGLGTKGVLLTPYFARQFVEHVKVGATLNPEVDISRFN